MAKPPGRTHAIPLSRGGAGERCPGRGRPEGPSTCAYLTGCSVNGRRPTKIVRRRFSRPTGRSMETARMRRGISSQATRISEPGTSRCLTATDNRPYGPIWCACAWPLLEQCDVDAPRRLSSHNRYTVRGLKPGRGTKEDRSGRWCLRVPQPARATGCMKSIANPPRNSNRPVAYNNTTIESKPDGWKLVDHREGSILHRCRTTRRTRLLGGHGTLPTADAGSRE